MIYLLSGDDTYSIRKKLEALKSTNSYQINIQVNSEEDLNNLISAASSINLFSNQQLLLVNEPFFFYGKIEDDAYESLIKYCNNPAKNTDIIFYSLNKAFDRRLKVYKEIKKNAQEFYYPLLSEKDFEASAYQLIRNHNLNLNRECTSLLLKRSYNSLQILDNNLSLIENYPEEIDIDVLSSLLSEDPVEAGFDLVNAILNKDLTLAYKLYQDYCLLNDNNFKIIGLLASQCRYCYGCLYLKDNGYSNSEIADAIGGNSKSTYRVEKTLQQLNKHNKDSILKLLHSLSDLYYHLVSENIVDYKLNFELFLLKEASNG